MRKFDLEWVCAKCEIQNVMDAQQCKNCGSIGSLSDRLVKVTEDTL